MFSWGAQNTAEDLAETDTGGIVSEVNLPLSPDPAASVLDTAAAAAATGSAPVAAAAAKSWFRDVLDAVLLIGLLHLVNIGFRWWYARRLLRKTSTISNNKNRTAFGGSTTSPTAASSSASTSSLMKGGSKFTSRFTKGFNFNKEKKKKKSARFQLSTGFDGKEDSDITSTTRTSNLASANNNKNHNNIQEDEESYSESTHNSHQQYYPQSRNRRGGLQRQPSDRSLQDQNRRSTMGRTWTIPQRDGLRPVVLNFATTTLEECLDQVDTLQTTVHDEFELVDILVKCCSQERVYFENYGAVASFLCQNSMKTTPRHSNVAGSRSSMNHHQYHQSPARFPRLNNNRSKWRQALERKFASCYRKDTKKLRKLRNMASFFSHLLATNAISYQVFDIVKLSEQHTTTASRYFLKILLKDLAHHLTLSRLQRRIQEFPHAFAGLVLLNPNHHRPPSGGSGSSTGSHGSNSKTSRRASVTSTTSTLTSYTTNSVLLNVKNMKFAIHYLTEIGLKPLSMDMRDHLLKLEKEQREQIQRQKKNSVMNTPGAKKKKLILEMSEHNRSVGPLLHEDESMPRISNHSVITDEASSTASSINSSSIQSMDNDRPIGTAPAVTSSNLSIISQLSSSTRSRSTSYRKTTAMHTPPPMKSSGSFAESSSQVSDQNSYHSRESQGARSSSSVGKVNKVRSSHRKLSRRIVPHAPPNLSSRNHHVLGAPQTPQVYKRNLFGVGARAPGAHSLSPKPNRPAAVRRLPNAPILDRSDSFEKLLKQNKGQHDENGDAESTSSSDSEILPTPRSGAVGVGGNNNYDNHYHGEDDDICMDDYNDVVKKIVHDDDDDDVSDEDLKDDMESDRYDYDVYYGEHNLGEKGAAAAAAIVNNEDTDGSVDTFYLPSDDDEAENSNHRRRRQQRQLQLDNATMEDDFHNRRAVAFRKRPSIITEGEVEQ